MVRWAPLDKDEMFETMKKGSGIHVLVTKYLQIDETKAKNLSTKELEVARGVYTYVLMCRGVEVRWVRR